MNRNRGKVSEMKSWNEIRTAATAFSKRWKNAFDEKAQAQSFLKVFFAVFGVDAVLSTHDALGAKFLPQAYFLEYLSPDVDYLK